MHNMSHRLQHGKEICLILSRGNEPVLQKNPNFGGDVIVTERKIHSRKQNELYLKNDRLPISSFFAIFARNHSVSSTGRWTLFNTEALDDE